MSKTIATSSDGTPLQPYPLLLTKEHMAELLKRHPRTVYRLERQGRLPGSVNIGSQRVWGRDEILQWIDRGCPSRRAWEKLFPKYRKREEDGQP